MAREYATAVRGHDAEWLLQIERIINDQQVAKAARDSGGRRLRDTSKLSVGVVYELDPREVAAARTVVVRAAAPLGADAVQELLAVLGLDEVEQPRTRLCQGCKRRSPSVDFADRGDGQSRCPACRARHHVDPLPDDVKRCRRCKVAKPLSEFHRNPTSGDGRQSRCKHCRSVQERSRAGQRSRGAGVGA